MIWQLTIVWIILIVAIFYLVMSIANSLFGSKKSCAGACSCGKNGEENTGLKGRKVTLIPLENLSLRKK